MRNSLEFLCSNLAENRKIIKSVFPLENSYIYPVCAEIFTEKRQTAQEEKLNDCRRILKENTGFFSNSEA